MTVVTTADPPPTPQTLAAHVRTHLQRIAVPAAPVTYTALADALKLTPPNTIHRLAEALEHLMREDAANGHPFIAALVISKARGGLPAPGFFETARQLGYFVGDPAGPEAAAFHEAALATAIAFWSIADGAGTDDAA